MEWVSVKERKPADNRNVLTCDATGTVEMGWYEERTGNWFAGGELPEYRITHWMPLPSAPSKADIQAALD
jgi:hypothetical protein